jgi:hypothetical protein
LVILKPFSTTDTIQQASNPLHLKLGKRWKIIIFCMFYIEIDGILFFYIKYALKLYDFHMCYMLEAYKRYTLKIPYEFYFHLIRIVQHFSHVFFCIISMHFSCRNNMNPSIIIICVKRNPNPSILPSSRCMYQDLPSTPSVPNYLTLSTKVFVPNWMTYLSVIQI